MHLQRTTVAVFSLLVQRQPAVRGRRSRHTTIRRPAAPRAHCQSGLQPSRSPSALRLVIQLAHVAVAVHHRTPPSVQSPRLSCLARRACEAVVAVQEVLIEVGGIVRINMKSPFRAAALPRHRRQEVAWSIGAHAGLPRRCTGAPATGPGRWPWRTRGGARPRPKPRQNRSTAWVSGARSDWARSSVRKDGQGGSQPREGPQGARGS